MQQHGERETLVNWHVAHILQYSHNQAKLFTQENFGQVGNILLIKFIVCQAHVRRTQQASWNNEICQIHNTYIECIFSGMALEDMKLAGVR